MPNFLESVDKAQRIVLDQIQLNIQIQNHLSGMSSLIRAVTKKGAGSGRNALQEAAPAPAPACSCKDYEDRIKTLEETVTAQGDQIQKLKVQLESIMKLVATKSVVPVTHVVATSSRQEAI